MRHNTNEYNRQFYAEHRVEILARQKEWRDKTGFNKKRYQERKQDPTYVEQARIRSHYYSSMRRFGRTREELIKELGNICRQCNKEAIGKGLHFDHIDGCGRNDPNPNNSLENIQPLCASCHAKKSLSRYHVWLKEQFRLGNVPV